MKGILVRIDFQRIDLRFFDTWQFVLGVYAETRGVVGAKVLFSHSNHAFWKASKLFDFPFDCFPFHKGKKGVPHFNALVIIRSSLRFFLKSLITAGRINPRTRLS